MVRVAVQLVDVGYDEDNVICASQDNSACFLANFLDLLNCYLCNVFLFVRKGYVIMNFLSNNRYYAYNNEVNGEVYDKGDDNRDDCQGLYGR